MDAHDALGHFAISPTTVEKRFSGRIHETLFVEAIEGRFVLQKIHQKYVPALPDIEAVTAALAQKGMPTSTIVKTIEGDLAVPDTEHAWRLMTYVPGRTIDVCTSVDEAAALGSFLGRFQSALIAYDAPFARDLSPFRDVTSDMHKLRVVHEQHTDLKEREIVQPFFDRADEYEKRITPGIDVLPRRVSHGDPKVNNFRFIEVGSEVRALIDLDTIGRHRMPIEVGDVLRSVLSGRGGVDRAWWQATTEAYRTAANFLTESEWKLIPDGFVAVTLSLAARYLRDAYEKKHFALDPVYPSLFEQNVARAEKNLSLLDSFSAHEAAIRNLHA